jgi:predicted TIM-barrel fold metal-dependent hydrolase
MADLGPVAEEVGALALIDHHVHPVLGRQVTPGEFERLITESDRPIPAGTSQFDSQLGIAVRRWCGPVLGLEPPAPASDYLARRAELGPARTARLLIGASGVDRLLVDTGYPLDGLLTLDGMRRLTGGRADEIVRLEQVAEDLARAGDVSAATFAGRFRSALWQRTEQARGIKSIIAYRHGLAFDPEPPAPAEVAAAAGRWLRAADATGDPRVRDAVLLRHLLWAGVERGLPVQIHTGFGDPDVDLRLANPLLLRGFLEHTQARRVPVMLLHCYPYHREAGYLAQAYPHVHLDLGLAVNYLGARAAAVVAEALELAPFAKVLYSSDAFALPELVYLGALLWRRATGRVLGEWVSGGEWGHADAVRIAGLIGAGNATRVYGL